MKKVLVMLLAALSIFALASCGGNDEAAENDNAESTTIKVGASVTLMLKFWKRQNPS